MARQMREIVLDWCNAHTKRIFTEMNVLKNTIDELTSEFSDPARIPTGDRMADLEYQFRQVMESFETARSYSALLECEKDESEIENDEPDESPLENYYSKPLKIPGWGDIFDDLKTLQKPRN